MFICTEVVSDRHFDRLFDSQITVYLQEIFFQKIMDIWWWSFIEVPVMTVWVHCASMGTPAHEFPPSKFTVSDSGRFMMKWLVLKLHADTRMDS